MQSIRTKVRTFATGVSALLLMLAPVAVRAQIAGTGNIQGTVSDASGAVVANATVILTDEATHVQRTTQTSGAGVYLFPAIPVGTYDVSAEAPGFKKYVQTKIVLEVGSSIAVNPTLAVGSGQQTVEVQAEGLALQTEDPTFKQTIDSNEVTEMPLNGRQMTALITASGGSAPAPAGDFTGSKYSYQTISVSIAGGGGNTTLWRLDGGDNQDYMANGNLPYPFPDAVSQFSVESTALGAQDGGHVGGMVNVVTKSGTNQYHGSAFEFIRNNYLDGTNFFSSTPDTLHQNQFGGTFGGPIRRNKLFAFAAYQRWIARQSQAATQATVPTAANLAGDYSVTDGVPGVANSNPCNSSHAPITLLDPLTGTALAGNKYATTPTYSPAGKALQKYLPTPQAATDPNNCGFVFYAIPYQVTDNQFVTRVDYTVSPKQNVYGRYFIDGYQFPAYFSPTNILITTQSGNIERVQNFTFGDAYTINPNVVNAAHISILRRVDNRGYAPNDINAGNLGVTLYQAVKNGLQISEGKFTIGGGTNSVAHFNDNTLAIDDDVTWVHGKHQIMFGGEWVQNQLNIGNAYESNGVFTFNGQYSGSGPKGGATIGDQNLDFLMGTLSAFQQSKFQQNALRGPIPSVYIQDTFHATSRLTVVGGLRWGPNIMPHDYFNRGVVFNMNNFLSNVFSSVYPNAPAGALFYGDKGVTRQFTKNSYLQFSPNAGVSYDPVGDGKTVIRAGGALMFDNPNFFTSQRNQQNPPFSTAISELQTSSTGPISFDAPWSVGSITTSPFPQPQIPTPSQAQFFPQSQFIVMPAQFKTAYSIQWTLSIQRQFGHGWQAQVDYMGNTTRHAPLGYTFDPATYIPGLWGANGTGCTGIVTTGPAAVKPGAAGTNCSTTGNQSSRFLLTQQNPAQGNQYLGGGGGSVIVGDEGTANYNGLVATIQHRLSNTFSLLGNWTWSKCLNIEDAQGDLAGTTVENIKNIMMDYGPCGSDYRHLENVSLVTRSNFTRFNRFTGLLVNGWELAPLMQIRSGEPFTVTAGQDNSLTDVGNDRPNLIPGANPYAEVKFHKATGIANRGFLNPAAFAQVTAPCPVDSKNALLPGCQYLGTYGNIGRNSFRGPKAFSLDAQISRIFTIHENWTTTLRLEAFNVLNHPNFNPPTGGSAGSIAGNSGSAAVLTSSTFGQVTSTSNQARVFQGSIKVSF
ncbi:MAG TPA: carboxypeptidase-like regulatory domain-containing protein [Terracidiphilus sp.]|nr:carboxypeptidase-like regulatory domain-containing protein [Terracidiphilus sp.]